MDGFIFFLGGIVFTLCCAFLGAVMREPRDKKYCPTCGRMLLVYEMEKCEICGLPLVSNKDGIECTCDEKFSTGELVEKPNQALCSTCIDENCNYCKSINLK
jgi:hypothetical protein